MMSWHIGRKIQAIKKNFIILKSCLLFQNMPARQNVALILVTTFKIMKKNEKIIIIFNKK
jgi:hypothetical protein